MKKLVLALAIATAATCVQADYASAIKAYEAKNYRVALYDFKQLAMLGDVDAQRNLAAMYFNAQGVEINALEAYGWFTLHTDQLTDKTTMNATLEKMKVKFSESEKQAVDAHVASLREQYGRLPLTLRLTPSFKDTEPKKSSTSLEAELVQGTLPAYTKDALLSEAEGTVRYSFLIDAQGKAIAINDESPAKTHQALKKAALKTLQASSFVVPTAKTLRLYYSTCFRIRDYGRPLSVDCPYGELSANNIGSRMQPGDKLPDLNQQLQTLAESGLASAYREQALSVLNNKSNSAADEHKITQLYYQAAIGADAPAQYALAQRLFNGQGCIADERKAINWLMLAAAGGDLDAQLQLASAALREGGEQNQSAKAQLQKLADKNMSRAAILLASVYAQSETLSEQKLALALLAKMPGNDVVVRALKARTYAGLSQFQTAITEQSKAVVAGKALGMDTANLEAALAAYQGSNLPVTML